MLSYEENRLLRPVTNLPSAAMFSKEFSPNHPAQDQASRDHRFEGESGHAAT